MPLALANDKSIAEAVALLRGGGCVGLPTETVYGLAADGLNVDAVSRIFEMKQRPTFDPLILHVPEGYDLSRICQPNETARRLIQKFWPGPLTVLLPKTELVPDLVTSGLRTVAVRCPSHPVAQKVLSGFGGPLAVPSANRFGRISPTTARAAQEELGEAAFILDAGSCAVGVESTIVNCVGAPSVLRQGGVALEEVRAVLGSDVGLGEESSPLPLVPGALKSHYAPATSLYRSRRVLAECGTLPDEYAYLFWQQLPKRLPKFYRRLTESGSAREAAARLFQFMRELDAMGVNGIICDPVPMENLGAAMNDRLHRASRGWADWDDSRFRLVAR
ncbi:MAG: L-threonylcarbamoyladenylate synthase [bacterium]